MPAIALGQVLENIADDIDIDYFCGSRPVERKLYSNAGIEPRVLPVARLSGGPWWRKAVRLCGLGWGFLKAAFLMRRYSCVVGMGGYITAPVLTAARFARVPIVLHESNALLGKVNRIIGPKAKVIACGMPLAELPEKIAKEHVAEIGTPVRIEITKGDPEAAASEMYMGTNGFTILVMGGSQGSLAVNKLLAAALEKVAAQWPDDGRTLQVIWSAGADKTDAVRDALKDVKLHGRIYIAPHIDHVEQAYALADLFVGRAGGSTLAEVLLCGLPSILFPLPIAADGHQEANAEVLRRHKAAIVRDEKMTPPEELADDILKIVNDSGHRKSMSDAARSIACPSAARDLARIVEDVARGNDPLAHKTI